MWDKIGEIARLLLPRITMDSAPWVHAAMQSGYPAQLGGQGGDTAGTPGQLDGTASPSSGGGAVAPRNKQRNEPGAGGFDANQPTPGNTGGSGFNRLSQRPDTTGGRANVASDPSNI